MPLRAKRDGVAPKRFFKQVLRSHGSEPRKMVTDKLRSYGVALRGLIPDTIHGAQPYVNNRARHLDQQTFTVHDYSLALLLITLFERTPIFSTSSSTRSPSFKKRRCSKPQPKPTVPEPITSPG